jgi:hypothetical protein
MNIIKVMWRWLYKKPQKSGAGRLTETILSVSVGAMGGWGIMSFILTLNPLYLLLVPPACIHLLMIGNSLRRLNIEHRKRDEEFKKTHDGMDMLTYVKKALDEAESNLKKIDNVEDLKKLSEELDETLRS